MLIISYFRWFYIKNNKGNVWIEYINNCEYINEYIYIYDIEKSGLIFSYGVTNSGKTFTIVGNDKNPGVLP